MFTTVGTLIRASVMELEAIAAGDSPSSEEYADALVRFNNMLGQWSAKRYILPFMTSENFAIAASVVSRTFGNGGQLGTARPLKIINAFLRDSSGYDCPLRAFNLDQYQAIPLKALTAKPTTLFYYQTYPLGTLYFNCITDAAYTLFLDTQKPFGQYTAITDDLNMSPEYHEPAMYNLTIRLAAPWGINLRPATVALAKEGLRDIKRLRAADTVSPVPLPSGLSDNSALSLNDLMYGGS